jgi:coenzyme PQQ synthesis protein D (PqqD)
MSIRCYTKDKNLVARSIAGETLIVPVRSGIADLDYIYALNEVGSRVWGLLDERTPVSQIVDAISAEYDVSPGQAARDIDELIQNLQTAALIHPVGASKG